MKIMDESILFFSRVSLSKFSLEAPIFHRYKGKFFLNRMVWRLGLTIGLSREFKSRVNDLSSLGLLSYSAITSMTSAPLHASHVC